jgi:hypothetical protein
MKTAGRENLNRWTILSGNRALGAGGQNRSCSIQWAAKQEKVRPMQKCFFLTSTFIELTRQNVFRVQSSVCCSLKADKQRAAFAAMDGILK